MGFDFASATPDEIREESRRRRERRESGKPLEPDAAEFKARLQEDDDRIEKLIQRDVWKLYHAFGCECFWLSQARSTRQTAGVPDLIVFHRRSGVMFFHEVKTPTGIQSPAQAVFEELCKATGRWYALGGVRIAEETLILKGIAVRIGDALEPKH